jgi:hypothetical protein
MYSLIKENEKVVLKVIEIFKYDSNPLLNLIEKHSTG